MLGEGAAGGGGRTSFAWAVIHHSEKVWVQVFGAGPVLSEVQASQKSSAALAAEHQALLQEQRAPLQAMNHN